MAGSVKQAIDSLMLAEPKPSSLFTTMLRALVEAVRENVARV